MNLICDLILNKYKGDDKRKINKKPSIILPKQNPDCNKNTALKIMRFKIAPAKLKINCRVLRSNSICFKYIRK